VGRALWVISSSYCEYDQISHAIAFFANYNKLLSEFVIFWLLTHHLLGFHLFLCDGAIFNDSFYVQGGLRIKCQRINSIDYKTERTVTASTAAEVKKLQTEPVQFGE